MLRSRFAILSDIGIFELNVSCDERRRLERHVIYVPGTGVADFTIDFLRSIPLPIRIRIGDRFRQFMAQNTDLRTIGRHAAGNAATHIVIGLHGIEVVLAAGIETAMISAEVERGPMIRRIASGIAGIETRIGAGRNEDVELVPVSATGTPATPAV